MNDYSWEKSTNMSHDPPVAYGVEEFAMLGYSQYFETPLIIQNFGKHFMKKFSKLVRLSAKNNVNNCILSIANHLKRGKLG